MRTAIDRFGRNESGAIIVFALLFFVLIVAFTGIAVDVARFETERTALQGAVDRGVLAATDLEQTVDTEEIVADYVRKAGYDDVAIDVDVAETRVGSLVAGRRVAATTDFDMNTYFMRLLGISDLTAPAESAAIESVTNVEIVLVLDTSGSMAQRNRMEYLKEAANDFIDTMIPEGAATDGPGVTTISIVPYSMTVNLGDVASYYSITGEHDYSACVFFDGAHFDRLDISTSEELRRYTHFDDDDSGVDGNHEIRNPLCPRGTRNQLVLPTVNRDRLFQAVAALTPYEATGIDAAMKWGLAMLDPSTRGVIEAEIAAGRLDAAVTGRPTDYTSAASDWKVVVLMTDGENDPQRDLREELRTGWSPIFFDDGRNRFSHLLRGRIPLLCDGDGDGLYEADTDGDDPGAGTYDDEGEHDGRYVTESECRAAEAADPDIFADRDIVWYWQHNDAIPNLRSAEPGYPDTSIASDAGRRDEWQHLRSEIERLRWVDVWNYVPLQRFYGDFVQVPRNVQNPPGGKLIGDAQAAIYQDAERQQTSLRDTEDRLWRLCDQAKETVLKDADYASSDGGSVVEAPRVKIYSVILDAPSDRARNLLERCASSPNDAFDVRGTEINSAFNAIANNISQLRLVQ